MGKLLMCGVSVYLLLSGLAWGPACGGLVVLVTFWDYFSQMAGEIVEDQVAASTRKRLRSDIHAAAHPYWVLKASTSGAAKPQSRDLAVDEPCTIPIFAIAPRELGQTSFLALLNSPEGTARWFTPRERPVLTE
jgi:hypothetical protein